MLIFFSYLFYFIAASASPLQRRWLATKKPDQSGQIAFAFRIALIVAGLGLLLPLFSPFSIQGSTLTLFLLSLACGIFGAVYMISMYLAQQHVQAGLTTLISNIYTPVAIIMGTLFLHEGLQPIQLLGTILLLSSILLLAAPHRIGRFHFDKHFLSMVLSGIALGLLLTAERALIKTTGFSAGTLFSWWSQVAGLGIVALMTRSKTTYSTQDIAVTGILRFLQSLSWVILLALVGNLSIVSAITTFKVVVIFIAAAIFLKERDDLPRKIIGSLIALAGLLLVK